MTAALANAQSIAVKRDVIVILPNFIILARSRALGALFPRRPPSSRTVGGGERKRPYQHLSQRDRHEQNLENAAGAFRGVAWQAHSRDDLPSYRAVKSRKAGTHPGTLADILRRRMVVEDLSGLGLSIRGIAAATGIPRSSVHRAVRAMARARAKQEADTIEIMKKLLGKRLSRQGEHSRG